MELLNSPSSKRSIEEIINSLDKEEKIKVKEIFDLFDKNLDGEIDLKELKFIMNSLDIFPSHDELTQMMKEADVDKDGIINENDFMYIISKQKVEHKEKLVKEARDTFVALGGNSDLTGTISTLKIKQILKGEFELNDDHEKILKKIYQDRDDISFDDFIKFFQ